MSNGVDRDGVQADLDQALEQAEFADNGDYDSPEARIWHCTAAVRKVVDAVKKVLATLP